MTFQLDHNAYYRLPWNKSDNGISWLEPTTKCNLRCAGCYRDLKSEHKTLEETRADLEVFKKLRKSDCISIAGGDPLVYPHIVETVKMIKEMGWKPIINTNGVALTEEFLMKLKDAGAYGFTFHIDTSQKRPKVHAKTETELNEIRLHYAKMVAKAGGLSCSFNATITQKTLQEVPALTDWAQKHADIVHTMVYILYRSPMLTGDFDTYADGKPVTFGATYKETSWGGNKSVMASDIVDKMRESDPLYEPSAYLNGTANPDSLKWLLATRIVLGGKTIGFVSPRFMEIIQTFKHFFTGSYLSYAGPGTTGLGKLSSILDGFVAKKKLRLPFRLLARLLTNPLNLLRRAHIQTLTIIQPVNFEADGRQDMCDSCPDMTVHKGKLVWSCRLEEINQFGCFVQTYPKAKVKSEQGSPEREPACR